MLWRNYFTSKLDMLSDEDETEIIQHLTQAENGFKKWSVVESEHQSLFLAKVEGEKTPTVSSFTVS